MGLPAAPVRRGDRVRSTGGPFFIAAFVWVGCADRSQVVSSASSVRDSAGVTIVENLAPRHAVDAAWRMADRPDLTIGSANADPEAQLFRVVDGLRLDDGRIAIANGGTSEIRFYDSAGALLRSVGGRGGGPGEFQALAALRRYGPDSLVAFDTRQRRLTFYDLEGNMGRVATVTRSDGSTVPPLQATVGVYHDGSLFMPVFDPFSRGPQDGPSRGMEAAFRVDGEGGVIDSVGAFPGRELYIQAREDGGMRTTPRIFGRTTFYAITSTHFFAGSNERYEIARYTPDGRLDMSIRVDRDPIPVGDHHRDLFMQQRTADMPAAARLAFEERFRVSEPPPTFPAYDGIIADRQGNLWVGDYLLPEASDDRFTVFDGDGRWITDVDVPDDVSVLEIGADYVLAVETDELDVEHVRLYRLTKPAGAN